MRLTAKEAYARSNATTSAAHLYLTKPRIQECSSSEAVVEEVAFWKAQESITGKPLPDRFYVKVRYADPQRRPELVGLTKGLVVSVDMRPEVGQFVTVHFEINGSGRAQPYLDPRMEDFGFAKDKFEDIEEEEEDSDE